MKSYNNMSTGVDELEHGLIIVCKNQEVEYDNEL